MKYFVLISFILLGNTPLTSQNKVDSLLQLAIKTDSSIEKCTLYETIASFYTGNNKDSADKYIDFAVFHSLQTKDLFLQASIAMTYADIHQFELSIDTLEFIANRYFSTDKIQEDTAKWISALTSYGAFYANKGIPLDGMKHYIHGNELAEQAGDFTGAGKLQYNMGSIYYNMGMIDQSLPYFQKATSLFKKAKNDVFQVIAMSSVGNVFTELEQLDSALYIANKVLMISDSLDYTRGKVTALSLLSSLYIKKEDYAQALSFALKTLPEAEKFGSQFSLANTHNNLGMAYYHNEEYEKSIIHFDKALSYPIMQNNPLSKHFIVKPLAFSLAEIGEYKKAAKLFQDYINYQDTVINEENKTIIADLEKKYDNTKNELQIQHQQNIIEQKSRQKNVLLYSLIALGLLAAGTIWFLVYRRKKERIIQSKETDLREKQIENLQKENEISSLTAMLEGQENERKRIAQDLHDGLGGLLASVKTRIGLIEEEINQLAGHDLYGQTNSMIDKACSEVRRISQNLMPTSLRLYGLQDAIDQLIHEKETTYSLSIDYEKLGDKEQRYEDSKEVFTYRIVQEGLTNALKHAEASEILIQIGTYADHIHVVLEDNGKGFTTHEPTKGIGLHSIRSRVEYMKGTFDLRSKENEGTCITINIPIHIID